MTRFARAKGSKSSNERLPEEATSWSEMKQQLLEKNKEIGESKKRQEAVDKRNANYKAFLEEKEAENTKNTKWAEFPGITNKNCPHDQKKFNRKNKSVSNNSSNRICTEKNFDFKNDGDSSDDETFSKLKAKIDIVLDNQKGKNCDDLCIDKDAISDEEASIKKLQTPINKQMPTQKKKLKVLTKNEEKQMVRLAKKLEEDTAMQNSDSDTPPDEVSSKVDFKEPIIKIKKVKRNKAKIVIAKGENQTELDGNKNVTGQKRKAVTEGGKENKKKVKKTNNSNEIEVENMVQKKNSNGQLIKATPKKSNKGKDISTGVVEKKKIIKENLTERDIKKIEKKKQKRIKQVEKKKREKQERRLKEELNSKQENGVEGMDHESQTLKSSQKHFLNERNTSKNKDQRLPRNTNERNNNFIKPQKKGKIRDKEEHQRRKPFLPHKMFINGKELEIDYVEGFPVKREDADRLKKLRKEMISKGLPRSEIDISLKLERRKAEKALTREKKKVCFNCRKSGHNLSECPELNKDQVTQTAGTGICFKCGSTEHTHFECKVIRGQAFNFAQCFICNEQGHIARQCPDNARGLYPKGGSCNVCGDVTHLKKDCPKYQSQQQRQDDKFKIETYGSSNPDVLEETSGDGVKVGNKRPNKIVKF